MIFVDTLAAYVCRVPQTGILPLHQSRRLLQKLQSMPRLEAQT